MKLEAVADSWEIATKTQKCDWHEGLILPGQDYLNMLVRVNNDSETGEPDYVTLTLCEFCALQGPIDP